MLGRPLRAVAFTAVLVLGAQVWVVAPAMKSKPEPKPAASWADLQRQLQPSTAPSSTRPPVADLPPWERGEWHAKSVRERTRQAALQALSRARVACDRGEHERFMSPLREYIFHRMNQQRGFARWGEEGERFGEAAWGTDDDRRIDSLLRQAYKDGRFRLDEIDAGREMVRRLVGDVEPAAPPCPG
jgi:hypothetical protein